MTLPLVSVIVPTYNRESLLPRAIDSIVAQTDPRWEIVVVDDGSTDRTPELAWSLRRRLGERFVYVRQENQGCCAARNRGIDECRGEFVAFLDSDDEFLPRKIERQLALFQARPQVGLVYSDYAYIDLGGRRYESAFDTKCPMAREVPCGDIEPGLKVCRGSLFDTLIRDYFVATIVGMVRRSVLSEDIRFSEAVRYAAEWVFYLDTSRRCEAGFVDEPLALHHFLRGSLTRTDKARNNRRFAETLAFIERRFSGEMSPAHQRNLRRRLAVAHRQAGYDATVIGQRREAACHFWKAVACRPNPRDLANCFKSGAAAILRPSGRRKAGSSLRHTGLEPCNTRRESPAPNPLG